MTEQWIIGGKCEACWAENHGEGCDWAMCGCSCHDEDDDDYWQDRDDDG